MFYSLNKYIMATITIENVPENIIKMYGTKMKYTRDFVFPSQKNIEDMTLLEYINSDEYKNEKKNFVDYDVFVQELKSKLNVWK